MSKNEKRTELLAISKHDATPTMYPCVKQEPILPQSKKILPDWKTIGLEDKIALVPAPRDAVKYARNKLGAPIRDPRAQEPVYDLTDPNIYYAPTPLEFESLHDPLIKTYLAKPLIKQHLKDHNLIDEDNNVLCTLKQFNEYRAHIKKQYIQDMVREQERADEKSRAQKEQDSAIRKYMLAEKGHAEDLIRDAKNKVARDIYKKKLQEHIRAVQESQARDAARALLLEREKTIAKADLDAKHELETKERQIRREEKYKRELLMKKAMAKKWLEEDAKWRKRMVARKCIEIHQKEQQRSSFFEDKRNWQLIKQRETRKLLKEQEEEKQKFIENYEKKLEKQRERAKKRFLLSKMKKSEADLGPKEPRYRRLDIEEMRYKSAWDIKKSLMGVIESLLKKAEERRQRGEDEEKSRLKPEVLKRIQADLERLKREDPEFYSKMKHAIDEIAETALKELVATKAGEVGAKVMELVKMKCPNMIRHRMCKCNAKKNKDFTCICEDTEWKKAEIDAQTEAIIRNVGELLKDELTVKAERESKLPIRKTAKIPLDTIITTISNAVISDILKEKTQKEIERILKNVAADLVDVVLSNVEDQVQGLAEPPWKFEQPPQKESANVVKLTKQLISTVFSKAREELEKTGILTDETEEKVLQQTLKDVNQFVDFLKIQGKLAVPLNKMNICECESEKVHVELTSMASAINEVGKKQRESEAAKREQDRLDRERRESDEKEEKERKMKKLKENAEEEKRRTAERIKSAKTGSGITPVPSSGSSKTGKGDLGKKGSAEKKGNEEDQKRQKTAEVKQSNIGEKEKKQKDLVKKETAEKDNAKEEKQRKDDEKKKKEAEEKGKKEAEERGKMSAEQNKKKDLEDKNKKEEEARKKKEAEDKEKKEAAARGKMSAEDRAKKDADDKQRNDEEKKKKEAEEKERKEAEEKAKKEAEARQKMSAEEKQKNDAEDKKKNEDEKRKKEAEERAKKEAEEKAKKEAEDKAKKEAEEKAKKEAEEKAKKEAVARREMSAEDRQKKDAEDKNKIEDEKRKKEADEKAKKEAEEKAKKEAEEKAKKEAEEKAKKEAVERREMSAEDRQKKYDEDKKKIEDEKRKKEADERAKKEAEERQKKDAEDKMKMEEDERKKKESEEKKKDADAKSKLSIEEKAKRDAEDRQRKEDEAAEREGKAAEEKQKKQTEEAAKVKGKEIAKESKISEVGGPKSGTSEKKESGIGKKESTGPSKTQLSTSRTPSEGPCNMAPHERFEDCPPDCECPTAKKHRKEQQALQGTESSPPARSDEGVVDLFEAKTAYQTDSSVPEDEANADQAAIDDHVNSMLAMLDPIKFSQIGNKDARSVSSENIDEAASSTVVDILTDQLNEIVSLINMSGPEGQEISVRYTRSMIKKALKDHYEEFQNKIDSTGKWQTALNLILQEKFNVETRSNSGAIAALNPDLISDIGKNHALMIVQVAKDEGIDKEMLANRILKDVPDHTQLTYEQISEIAKSLVTEIHEMYRETLTTEAHRTASKKEILTAVMAEGFENASLSSEAVSVVASMLVNEIVKQTINSVMNEANNHIEHKDDNRDPYIGAIYSITTGYAMPTHAAYDIVDKMLNIYSEDLIDETKSRLKDEDNWKGAKVTDSSSCYVNAVASQIISDILVSHTVSALQQAQELLISMNEIEEMIVTVLEEEQSSNVNQAEFIVFRFLMMQRESLSQEQEQMFDKIDKVKQFLIQMLITEPASSKNVSAAGAFLVEEYVDTRLKQILVDEPQPDSELVLTHLVKEIMKQEADNIIPYQANVLCHALVKKQRSELLDKCALILKEKSELQRKVMSALEQAVRKDKAEETLEEVVENILLGHIELLDGWTSQGMPFQAAAEIQMIKASDSFANESALFETEDSKVVETTSTEFVIDLKLRECAQLIVSQHELEEFSSADESQTVFLFSPRVSAAASLLVEQVMYETVAQLMSNESIPSENVHNNDLMMYDIDWPNGVDSQTISVVASELVKSTFHELGETQKPRTTSRADINPDSEAIARHALLECSRKIISSSDSRLIESRTSSERDHYHSSESRLRRSSSDRGESSEADSEMAGEFVEKAMKLYYEDMSDTSESSQEGELKDQESVEMIVSGSDVTAASSIMVNDAVNVSTQNLIDELDGFEFPGSSEDSEELLKSSNDNTKTIEVIANSIVDYFMEGSKKNVKKEVKTMDSSSSFASPSLSLSESLKQPAAPKKQSKSPHQLSDSEGPSTSGIRSTPIKSKSKRPSSPEHPGTSIEEGQTNAETEVSQTPAETDDLPPILSVEDLLKDGSSDLSPKILVPACHDIRTDEVGEKKDMEEFIKQITISMGDSDLEESEVVKKSYGNHNIPESSTNLATCSDKKVDEYSDTVGETSEPAYSENVVECSSNVPESSDNIVESCESDSADTSDGRSHTAGESTSVDVDMQTTTSKGTPTRMFALDYISTPCGADWEMDPHSDSLRTGFISKQESLSTMEMTTYDTPSFTASSLTIPTPPYTPVIRDDSGSSITGTTSSSNGDIQVRRSMSTSLSNLLERIDNFISEIHDEKSDDAIDESSK